MNGRPKFATVALGLPNSVSVEMVDELYRGMAEAAHEFDLSIVGGDTTASHRLVLSITVIGECRKDELVRRSGAGPGDLICVSGHLGTSYAGLRILQHHKQQLLDHGEGYQPDLAPFANVVGRHLRPMARTDIIKRLHDRGLRPTAMIDLSDGLSSDLQHICTSSGCGSEIEFEALPVLEETQGVAETLEETVDQYILRGGEDYELLFTVHEKDGQVAHDLDGVTVVGRCTAADDGIKLRRGGTIEDIGPAGFVHF
jgi:thiamine-monophosphate kinase